MEKNKYSSKYTNRKVSAAAFLTDFICERLAAKAGETLPYKYWSSPKWAKVFKWQLVAANALLEEVNIIHILAFLRSHGGQKILSLGQKTLILEGSKKFITVDNVENVFVAEDDYFECSENEFVDVPKVSQWELLQ